MNIQTSANIPHTPLLPVVEQYRQARLMLSEFIMKMGLEGMRLDRRYEQIEKDLEFLVPFFESCVEGRFQLHPPRRIDSVKIHRDILTLTGPRAISGTYCVPLNDSGSGPAWASAEAMRQDFFKLLFQSVNTQVMRNTIAARRPSKWVNTKNLEWKLWHHLGQHVSGCLVATLKPLMPKPYYWKHYGQKLFEDVPFPILRECLLAYALGDERMFRIYRTLAEDSQHSLILGPQKYIPDIWLIFCGEEG